MRPENALYLASPWKQEALRDDLGFRDMAAAARQSLEYYRKLPAETQFTFGPDLVSVLDVMATLQDFLLIVDNEGLTAGQKLSRIRENFLFYRAAGRKGGGKVLFTGYYEPMLSCRTKADESFRYPIYRRPEDLIGIDLSQFGGNYPKNTIYGRLGGNKLVPYYSRKEIDREQALAEKGLELLWCSDPVDIFVLQVQGSGKADLGNGNFTSVLYDGQNGRPYRSIGKYLIDRGAIAREDISLDAIRNYLSAHPDQALDILDQNQSYVFFRLGAGPSVGSIGTALTPERSIATDKDFFPPGALGFIRARKPVIEKGIIKEWTPFSRFVMNQDTGGAIKGPGRADLFCGQGAEAELTAGNLQHEGELYFLLRKDRARKIY